MPTKKSDKGPAPPAATTPAVADSGGSSGNNHAPLKRFYYQVQQGTLCVSIWDKVLKLESGELTVYSTALQRSYRDGETRKWTNYLRESDLPTAALGLQEAYRWLHEIKQPVPPAPQPQTSGSEDIPF